MLFHTSQYEHVLSTHMLSHASQSPTRAWEGKMLDPSPHHRQWPAPASALEHSPGLGLTTAYFHGECLQLGDTGIFYK